MTGPPRKRRAPPGGSGAPSKSIAEEQHSQDRPPRRIRSRRPPGLIPIGPVAAEIVADLRFRRQVLRLHRLGPRAMAELLAEIGGR